MWTYPACQGMCESASVDCVSAHIYISKDPSAIPVVTHSGYTALQIAARSGYIEIVQSLLSMEPSSELQNEALTYAPETCSLTISQLSVSEWQRQLGLQNEFLFVEGVVSVFSMMDGEADALAHLVLQGEVLRATRYLFEMSQQHGRGIAEVSLEAHKRMWLEKFPCI